MNDRAGTIADSESVGFQFDTTYATLPEELFERTVPARVRAPRIVILNHRLAKELGLNLAALTDEAAAALFAGQALPAGVQPIAQAYAGHQYGGFTMLGDGRAILLGEHVSPSGQRVDIQFKGSGRTRFSRGGDGRAVLGPMLREYIVSEAMAALGIPSTRSLAVVTTGEPVFRTTPEKGRSSRASPPAISGSARSSMRPAATNPRCGRSRTMPLPGMIPRWRTLRRSTARSSAR